MRKAIVMVMVLALGGALLAGCGVANTERLTATTWYLVSGGEKSPSWQWTVPADDQAKYTIRFESDGRFTSQADCNQLAGSWQAPGSDRVNIVPGPMTMAFCGEMSFDILYAGLLGQATNWGVVSTGMSLTLADGGRLDYTSVAPPSPSPTTEPATPEPTLTPTPTPTTTVTATATTTATTTATATATATTTTTATAKPPSSPTTTAPPTATATPTPTPPPPTGPGLTGRAWQLTAFALHTPQFEGAVPADQQSRFTIEFREDGTFTAQADCNTVNGTYSPTDPSGSSGGLSLVPGPVTIKACGEGSYGDLYITGIASTASFDITGDDLVLTLVDAGRLEYR